ncbi:MAG TPA: fibronectin type III-like domain-contianing protein [Verrucomicrobiae bacterium]|jgi:beta-glucosidase
MTVANTGKCDGDEVVQVYATAVNSPVPMPLRQLVGFRRVFFKVAETKTVEISVPVNLLRRWSEAENRYVVDPGTYEIVAGPSSDEPLVKANLNIPP